MLTYLQRSQACLNPTAKTLLEIVEAKKSNLAISIDVTTKRELLSIIDTAGAQVCLVKTHIDIIEDFDQDLLEQLTALSQKHRFIIFEDRKFADIGNTVKMQYQKGIYKIASWAKITNAHILPGPGIIQGLKTVGLPLGNALLLLAELSSQGNLITADYTQRALALAKEHKDFVIGFISQHKLTDDPALIHFTPGINLTSNGDQLGQSYVTPHQAIVKNGTDIIIVGRGIYQSANLLKSLKDYQQAGWDAYQTRLRSTYHGSALE